MTNLHKVSASFSLLKLKFKFFIFTLIKTIIKIVKPYFFNKLKPFSFRQYLGSNQIMIRTKQGFPLFILGNDASITPRLILTGVWEPYLTSFLSKKTEPKMTVMDIGANMGYYSALFASKGAYVHAFEPNPLLQEVLKKNISINAGLSTSKCAVNKCAVGESEGIVTMYLHSFLTGSGTIAEDVKYQGFIDSSIGKPEEVNVITIDKYVAVNKLEKVDIIKIDVEGYEEKALKGATKLLTQSQDFILCMEYTKGRYSDDFPFWLFNLFSKAYLPKFKQSIDVKFLDAYERGEIFPFLDLLEIIFIKGRRSF